MIDCIIVGAGPAGLSAAVNLRQRNRECLVLSSGASVLRKAEWVENCIGLPHLTGNALMETLTAHALQRGVRIETKKVGNILPFGDVLMVNADGDILECRTVILATGTARSAAVPGEEALLGHGVSYCATCDGMLYRGKSCVVWGLADDAPEEAAYLAGIGVQVTYVSTRRPAELDSRIRFVAGRLKGVEGDGRVERAVLENDVLPCEGVFILRASIAPARLLEGLAVNGGAVAVDRSMATNIPGVFAAGDCTGAPYQVSKALGEGQVAGLAAAELCAKADKKTE